MHLRLPHFALIFLALLTCLRAHGQDPFAASPVPTFNFTETVTESLDADDESIYKGGLHIKGRVSMAGIDLSTIDGDTLFEIYIETSQLDEDDLDLYTTLDGGSDFDDIGPVIAGSIAQKTLTFQINSADSDKLDGVGTLKITWNATEMNYAIDITNGSTEYSVLAQSLADEYTEDEGYQDIATLDVIFAEHELSYRTIYVSGTARVVYDANDNPLARENISGAIDSAAPRVTISNPAAQLKFNIKPYVASGTATDEHLSRVEVTLNSDTPIVATLSGENWSVSLSNFKIGENRIVVTAYDEDENSTATAPRKFTYYPGSTLTVRAAGPGSGSVTSGYFKTLNYPANSQAVSIGQRVEGTKQTVTATANFPASVFDGWTSVPPLWMDEDASASKLTFRMQPNQVLTAHFILNPFLGKFGKFSGLVRPNATGGAQGFVALKITNKGTFTGKFKIGKISVPVKGSLANSLQFSRTFTVAGVPYAVTFALTDLPSGAHQVTGSINGGGIDSSIAADLSTFSKSAPAPQAGSYNVLLPAAAGAGADFPVGVGFGRVKVSVKGLTKFVGKLGDGTVVSFGTTLSADGVWPFFAALYGKTGSISGSVTFDDSDLDHDLSGTLDWTRPPGIGKVHRTGFSGQSDLIGARYAKPATGLIFLTPNGAGLLSLDAPAATVPMLPTFSTDPDLSVTLAPVELQSTVTIGDATLGVKVKISGGSGLFSGSFNDPAQAGKTLKFSGAIVQKNVNAAGGLFIRGDRTGAVQIAAPPEQNN